MITARRLGAALFGAFVGGWLGRALFRWLLDLERTTELVLIVASAALGAVVCVAGAVQAEREDGRPPSA